MIDALDYLHRLLSRAWREDSPRPGTLSHSEYEYLRALERLKGGMLAKTTVQDDHGPHLQDLTEVLGVRKASASAAVAKLEKRGLVTRYACQRDARAQHIVLTDKAQAALREEMAAYNPVEAQIRTVLSEDEFQDLNRLLKKLQSSL